MGPGPWHRPAVAARGAAGTGPGEHQNRQRPRNKLPRMPSTTRVREKTRQTLQEGGLRPADAERSRMWEALGSGERRPDAKAAATTRSAPGQGPLGAGRDSCGPRLPGPQRNQPRGACSSVASPSRSVAFTGRRAGESRVLSPGARRNQLQRTK